jgi:GAF domain-containing protein
MSAALVKTACIWRQCAGVVCEPIYFSEDCAGEGGAIDRENPDMTLATTQPAAEFSDADVLSLDVDLAEVTAEMPALRLDQMREGRGSERVAPAAAADDESVSRAPPSLGDRYLGLLRQAAQVLRADVSADEMLRALFHDIREPVGVDAYFSFMVNEAGDALALSSCVGVTDDQARAFARVEFGHAVCGNVALKRAPVVIRGIQESNDRRVQIVKNLGIRAVACHPLLAGDRLLGTLSFASRTRDEFGVEELGFFGAVARAVALSYERSRLARELAAVEGELDALGASAEGASIAQFETAPEVAEVVSLAGAEGVPAVAEDAQLAEREAQVEEVLLAPPEGAIEDVQSAPREDEPAEAPSAAVESPIELIEATPVGAEVILFARYAAAVAAAADVPLGLIEAAPVSALEVSPLTDVAHDDAAHEETVE